MRNDLGLGIVLAVTCLAAFVAYLVGLVRFAAARAKEAKASAGVKVHAGGVLFVEGSKTYYTMPNGQRRKIADKPLDLSPGSADMVQFTAVLNKAYAEYQAEKDEEDKRTVKAMHEVAREAARG